MSTEDLTTHSIEHFSAKSKTGGFKKLVENSEFLDSFTKNYMLMPAPLDSSAF
jgi:hypothetical protein